MSATRDVKEIFKECHMIKFERRKKEAVNMKWITISCILCVFGCFKEFRPSESFVTDYLTGPWKNFTDTQVSTSFVKRGVSTHGFINFPIIKIAYFKGFPGRF